jgi:hypothetical protein
VEELDSPSRGMAQMTGTSDLDQLTAYISSPSLLQLKLQCTTVLTASVVEWSEFLAYRSRGLGSISGATIFSEK